MTKTLTCSFHYISHSRIILILHSRVETKSVLFTTVSQDLHCSPNTSTHLNCLPGSNCAPSPTTFHPTVARVGLKKTTYCISPFSSLPSFLVVRSLAELTTLQGLGTLLLSISQQSTSPRPGTGFLSACTLKIPLNH